jgi:hypothetical protein
MAQLYIKSGKKCGGVVMAAPKRVFAMRKALWSCEPNSSKTTDAKEKEK